MFRWATYNRSKKTTSTFFYVIFYWLSCVLLSFHYTGYCFFCKWYKMLFVAFFIRKKSLPIINPKWKDKLSSKFITNEIKKHEYSVFNPTHFLNTPTTTSCCEDRCSHVRVSTLVFHPLVVVCYFSPPNVIAYESRDGKINVIRAFHPILYDESNYPLDRIILQINTVQSRHRIKFICTLWYVEQFRDGMPLEYAFVHVNVQFFSLENDYLKGNQYPFARATRRRVVIGFLLPLAATAVSLPRLLRS